MLKITVIACGNKMPAWVNEGTQEYAKRLKEYVHPVFIEIPLLKRSKSSSLSRIAEKEAGMILAAIPASAHVIALEIGGNSFCSEELAKTFQQLELKHSHICFLIGGPEGLAPEVLARCDGRWSLSALTFPHTLARIILLESIYRAYSIIHHHPYHRG